MEAGSLGLTPNSLYKAKSLHHFIISVEMVNFLLGSYKTGGANKCIFQFFLLMLRISLEILIFRYSAQILLEIMPAEFIQAYIWVSRDCGKRARAKNGGKIVQTTLYESVAIAGKERESKMAGRFTGKMVQTQSGRLRLKHIWCNRFTYLPSI